MGRGMMMMDDEWITDPFMLKAHKLPSKDSRPQMTPHFFLPPPDGGPALEPVAETEEAIT